jgi:hypothetical protein
MLLPLLEGGYTLRVNVWKKCACRVHHTGPTRPRAQPFHSTFTYGETK